MTSSVPPNPPEAWEPLLRLGRLARRPLERFLRIEASSGVVLLVTAAVAMLWANSRWADSYAHLWHTPLGLRVGSFTFERSLEWFVNDVLMVIFFFVVGMEIRREVHHGELSDWRRAALPAAAALGGMVVPAGLYLLLAGGPETHSGWGVPMATDIAFAVGILALLGRRVPPALRVLLLALAVIDDLGAIVVIALFYSSGIALSGLGVAALGLALIFALRWLGVRAPIIYVVPGLVVWAGILSAGIHPTIAGVIIGLVTPVRAWLGTDGLLKGLHLELDQLSKTKDLSTHELSQALHHIDLARREALSPAESLIEALHPWVAFGIMPVFALANAGVAISVGGLEGTSLSVAVAVAAGLVVGKPLGVFAASGLALKLKIARLPEGAGVRQLVVLGLVAGVGFTMALFIAQLAFSNPALLTGGKLGVLAASGVAAVLALTVGRLTLSPIDVEAAKTADEAEGATNSSDTSPNLNR